MKGGDHLCALTPNLGHQTSGQRQIGQGLLYIADGLSESAVLNIGRDHCDSAQIFTPNFIGTAGHGQASHGIEGHRHGGGGIDLQMLDIADALHAVRVRTYPNVDIALRLFQRGRHFALDAVFNQRGYLRHIEVQGGELLAVKRDLQLRFARRHAGADIRETGNHRQCLHHPLGGALEFGEVVTADFNL